MFRRKDCIRGCRLSKVDIVRLARKNGFVKTTTLEMKIVLERRSRNTHGFALGSNLDIL